MAMVGVTGEDADVSEAALHHSHHSRSRSHSHSKCSSHMSHRRRVITRSGALFQRPPQILAATAMSPGCLRARLRTAASSPPAAAVPTALRRAEARRARPRPAFACTVAAAGAKRRTSSRAGMRASKRRGGRGAGAHQVHPVGCGRLALSSPQSALCASQRGTGSAMRFRCVLGSRCGCWRAAFQLRWLASLCR